MNKLKYIKQIIILIFLQASIVVNAQVTGLLDSSADFGIAVKSKAYEDSVVIRWAPTDGVAWMLSKKKGCLLYRVNYSLDGKTDTVLLTPKAVFPKSLDDFNKLAGTNNKYIGMAAQALYGKNFKTTDKAPETFMDEVEQQADAFNLRFYTAMMSADLSAIAADYMGLRWVDKDVKKGMIYSYIVRCDTAYLNIPLRAGITKVINGKPKKEPTPLGLIGLSDDRVIELHWMRKQPSGFTNYFIERSDDGGKTYKKLTDEPYFAPYDPKANSNDSTISAINAILRDYQIYIDSVPENYVDYYYRISGIDAFADVSPYCEPIKVHAIDKTPPLAPIVDSVVNIFNNQVYIHWIDNEKAPDLKGYFVSKGSDINGPFEPAHKNFLPANTNHFLDTAVKSSNEKLYYVVIAIDTNGNYSYSIPRLAFIVDTIPPSKPKSLVGKMSEKGVVGLQWTLNPESDVAGYKVYYSYKPNSGFIQVTQFPTTQNVFIDSLSIKSLNRSVYYKINAIDFNGNQSVYSDVVKIDKPNPIPPTAPVSKKIFVENNKVYMVWIGSSTEGVSHYEILRKTSNEENYTKIAEVKHDPLESEFLYIDSTIKLNVKYVYSVQAVDIIGIRSEKAFPVVAENSRMDIFEPPTEIKASYSEEKNSISLTWNYSSSEDDYYFVIYRSENDKPMRMWNTTDKNTKIFVDTYVQKGNTYKYSIEVKQEKGPYFSEKSKEVLVKP
ncbi:MAG: hypothetical protein J5I91_04430 [Bacteroidetes bacterium]|nr:hypothetical protein [Bacteroidota bacterium]